MFMQKYFYLLCILLFTAPTYSNINRSIPDIHPHMKNYFNVIQKDISNNGKVYRLFIAEPKAKTFQKTTALYLLDGNAHFPLAINAVNPNKTLPLIIGIGYVTSDSYDKVQRTRDYTFPAEGKEFIHGGGADAFLNFITDTLIPHIEQHYDVTSHQRYFFGHSFGGLFGLYILFNRPKLFQHYVIASPSLWWGGRHNYAI